MLKSDLLLVSSNLRTLLQFISLLKDQSHLKRQIVEMQMQYNFSNILYCTKYFLRVRIAGQALKYTIKLY